ncbi:MAG: hypothetical protein N2645_21185 [Clostridia bacterium]|nr:hypothetical protein [Clostridia bacterium]
MKYGVFPIMVVMAILMGLFSSCTNVAGPQEVLAPPQQSGNDNIMSEYRNLVNGNSAPRDILKFLDANIGNLNKEDADKVVTDFIEIQKKQLQNYEEKLYSPEFNAKISTVKFEDITKGENIKDADVNTFVQNAYHDGYKFFYPEGMVNMEIDYENINKRFSGFVSENVSAYLEIMSAEYKKHYAHDGGLIIDLDELVKRIIQTENFIEKYKDSPFQNEVRQLNKNYLSAYLLGLNNTPAFAYEDNQLREDVLSSFEHTVKEYKDSKLAGILKEYMELVRKNNNKKTGEILNFVEREMGK